MALRNLDSLARARDAVGCITPGLHHHGVGDARAAPDADAKNGIAYGPKGFATAARLNRAGWSPG
jgi:hypothetical protein